MKHDWSNYEGPLDRDKMSYEARVAYESFNAQKQKCRNPNNKWFKHYGGKGLKVHYGPREFIGWWLHNRKTFSGYIATVGRKDHDKGYFFENIEMQCIRDNSREAFLRNGLNKPHHCKVILVKDKNTGALIAEIPSIREAARLFDTSQRLIQFLVRGKYKQSKKINFALEMGDK